MAGIDRLELGTQLRPMLTDNPHIVHARPPKRTKPKRKPGAKPASVIVGPRKVAAEPDDGHARAEAADRLWRELVRRATGGREGRNQRTAYFCSISGQTQNSGRQKIGIGNSPERPESVRVFRHLFRSRPDVVASEIDVLPPERGEMSKELLGNLLDGA